jgi:hypothetical protein
MDVYVLQRTLKHFSIFWADLSSALGCIVFPSHNIASLSIAFPEMQIINHSLNWTLSLFAVDPFNYVQFSSLPFLFSETTSLAFE